MNEQQPAYLENVRNQPCCACGTDSVPRVAHHIRFVQEGGTGLKPSSWWTVPLCDRCHLQWHNHGAFLGMDRPRSENLQLRALAKQLVAWVEAF